MRAACASILAATTLLNSLGGSALGCGLSEQVIRQQYGSAVPMADERPIACKRGTVSGDELDDCGLRAYLLARSGDLAALVKEEKYSAKYISARLQAVVDDFGIGYTSLPARIVDVCRYVDIRNGNAPPPEAKPTPLLGERWSFGRKLSDANDPRGTTSINAPFVASVQTDHEKDKTTSSVYGTIGYRLWDAPDRVADLAATLAVDSTSADPASKSTVNLSLPYTTYFANPFPLFNALALTVTPQYQTDRNFNRRAYQFSAGLSANSQELARMGEFSCYPVLDCSDPNEVVRFLWKPSLGLDAGRVDDAAGNATLATVAKDGTYVRLVPSVVMQVQPKALSQNLTLQLAYRQRYDITRGWDRGYGEVNILYELNKNFFWTVIYRKGRKDVTFDPVNSVLFGFGYAQ